VELRAFLRILWRRWWLVVAPVLVVLAHLLVTYQSPPTFYQVVMRFAAGTVPAGLSVDYDRYYSWLTSPGRGPSRRPSPRGWREGAFPPTPRPSRAPSSATTRSPSWWSTSPGPTRRRRWRWRRQ